MKAIPKPDCVYPLGIDPAWHLGTNELAYLNSLKMKLSVILGVLQMAMGVCMKALNARYFKSTMDFYFEFVPQIILLLVLFGYMDVMIIAKWTTDFTGIESQAPSIISNMIDIALNGGAIPPGSAPLIGSAGTQQGISIFFLLVALVCVPTMLFPKPFHIDKMNKLHAHQAHHDDVHNPESVPLQEHHVGEVKEETKKPVEKEKLLVEVHNEDWRSGEAPKVNNNGAISNYHIKDLLSREPSTDGGHGTAFADIFIHQLIETIEFVLGTISNTASYLRLWALSLAHGQLAAVFLENTIMPAFEIHSVGGTFFGLWIGYFMWVSFTIGVLMSMDVMECFLHTLRLHWVEFQNKFYKGQGYKFTPFSFQLTLKEFTR